VADVVSIEDFRPAPSRDVARAGGANVVVFNRSELDLILQMYGRKVVAGEWCDYALEFAPESASFSVVRSAGRGPECQVVKWHQDCEDSGLYAVVSPGGQVLRRGRQLSEVLKLLDGRPRLL